MNHYRHFLCLAMLCGKLLIFFSCNEAFLNESWNLFATCRFVRNEKKNNSTINSLTVYFKHFSSTLTRSLFLGSRRRLWKVDVTSSGKKRKEYSHLCSSKYFAFLNVRGEARRRYFSSLLIKIDIFSFLFRFRENINFLFFFPGFS